MGQKGILVNDTCHAEWGKILDLIIFLWKEISEDACSRKNPYEEEYMKAFNEFTDKYGIDVFLKNFACSTKTSNTVSPTAGLCCHT